MRVALAYPYEGHSPDEIVELDDVVATQMIADGLARPEETRAPTPSPTGADQKENSR